MNKQNIIKFSLLTILIIIFGASAFYSGYIFQSYSNKSYENKTKDKYLKEYTKTDKETSDCIKKSYMSDEKMCECYYNGIKKYNIEIEKLILEFRKFHSQSQYLSLLKSQENWELFARENDKVLGETLETCFGTNPYVYSATVKYEYTQFRLLKLIDFYNINKEYNDHTCRNN